MRYLLFAWLFPCVYLSDRLLSETGSGLDVGIFGGKSHLFLQLVDQHRDDLL
jgi:hypothetical protein